jgi:carboxypeptidase C (cathepsin A)
MTEQGPFRPTATGNLTLNQHSWNKIANMVFIEQPVGVGFSTVSGGTINYGDEPSAQDNAAFMVGFLKRFDAFQFTDFFISSESYGGHYMPTLARELLKQGTVPTFKGVFLGNPLTFMPYRNFGQYGTAYGHQLLPKPLWDQYIAANCKDTWPTPAACNAITGQMDHYMDGFDAYALDFPVCEDSAQAAGRHERWMLMNHVSKANGGKVAGYFPDAYVACSSEYATTYLNRPDVQLAIHATPAHGQAWSQCSDDVGGAFNSTDVVQPMMPVWKEVLSLSASKPIKVMIYSGDDDSVCATMGTQQFVWDLLNVSVPWTAWKDTDNQIAGFLTRFDGGKSKFDFATVHGAGHMVPSTRPAQSLVLLQTFLGEY